LAKKLHFAWIIPFIFLVDRVLKAIVVRHFQEGAGFSVIPGVFHITRVNNRGAAFGLFQNSGGFLVAVAVLALVLMAVFVALAFFSRGRETVLESWAWALVIGGTLGNLYDRLRYGYVVDFLDFRVWPVFNIADTSICVGVFLIALGFLGKER
jgi:signal peptidase II